VVQLSLGQPARPIFVSPHANDGHRSITLLAQSVRHPRHLTFCALGKLGIPDVSSMTMLELVDVEDASFQSNQGAHDSRYGEFLDN
jgi:hypothetical protein